MCSGSPSGDTTATLQPFFIPGSMAKTTLPRSGADSNNRFKFVENTLMAERSAVSVRLLRICRDTKGDTKKIISTQITNDRDLALKLGEFPDG